MLEDDLALWVDGEPDVEEAVWELGVGGLGLGHDVGVPLFGQIAEEAGLGAGDVDGALAGVGDVIEVEHLVVERLEGALWNRDQSHGQIEAGEPRCGLNEVGDVIEVLLDLGAIADAPDGGDQANGGVRLWHGDLPVTWMMSLAGVRRETLTARKTLSR